MRDWTGLKPKSGSKAFLHKTWHSQLHAPKFRLWKVLCNCWMQVPVAGEVLPLLFSSSPKAVDSWNPCALSWDESTRLRKDKSKLLRCSKKKAPVTQDDKRWHCFPLFSAGSSTSGLRPGLKLDWWCHQSLLQASSLISTCHILLSRSIIHVTFSTEFPFLSSYDQGKKNRVRMTFPNFSSLLSFLEE